MDRKPAIRSLRIQNLLSFGSELAPIELRNLNVLIGPNGSGKSNLFEVIGLLQSAPKEELTNAISNGGGIDEWLWKGASQARWHQNPQSLAATVLPPAALIEAVIDYPDGPKGTSLRYRLGFTREGFRFEIKDEAIENEKPRPSEKDAHFYFRYVNGIPRFNFKDRKRSLRREEINPQVSVLAQRKDPEHYPEITFLGGVFSRIRIYRDWEFGGLASLRQPSDASLQRDFLEDDGSNLGVVLDRLLGVPSLKNKIIESLRLFYEGAVDLRSAYDGGRIHIRLEERHLKSGIPLNRMSDGTVRWLALLSILLIPDPPPLICIEEPELGLHPDMVHELGKLLIDASSRMQLIVTTHSDSLIEELSETPESVLVCEKDQGSTHVRRLDKEHLSEWLKEYSLGQLWRKGEIGGNRW